MHRQTTGYLMTPASTLTCRACFRFHAANAGCLGPEKHTDSFGSAASVCAKTASQIPSKRGGWRPKPRGCGISPICTPRMFLSAPFSSGGSWRTLCGARRLYCTVDMALETGSCHSPPGLGDFSRAVPTMTQWGDPVSIVWVPKGCGKHVIRNVDWMGSVRCIKATQAP